jgi:hypothetical protein
MPDETREVQYDDGEESLVLEDGQIARRGEPVTVSADLAARLCEQSIWWDLSVGKEAEAQREAEEQEVRRAEQENAKPAITEETAPQPPVTAGPDEWSEDESAPVEGTPEGAPSGEKTPEDKAPPAPQRPAPTAATSTTKNQKGGK